MSGVLVMVARRRLYVRVGRWQIEVGRRWVPFTIRVLGMPDTRPGWRVIRDWLVIIRLPRPEREDQT